MIESKGEIPVSLEAYSEISTQAKFTLGRHET